MSEEEKRRMDKRGAKDYACRSVKIGAMSREYLERLIRELTPMSMQQAPTESSAKLRYLLVVLSSPVGIAAFLCQLYVAVAEADLDRGLLLAVLLAHEDAEIREAVVRTLLPRMLTNNSSSPKMTNARIFVKS